MNIEHQIHRVLAVPSIGTQKTRRNQMSAHTPTQSQDTFDNQQICESLHGKTPFDDPTDGPEDKVCNTQSTGVLVSKQKRPASLLFNLTPRHCKTHIIAHASLPGVHYH